MAEANLILTNFTAGELSPRLAGRVDQSKYYNGCKTLQNMLIYPHGGAVRRPGTYFVAEAKDSSKKVRLIPFEFSTEQAYILEFGHQYMRVYKDNGQVESGGSPYEISTPYQESELFELKYVQSADTMYIVHPNHKPKKLTRTGHTSWTLSDYAPTADPFTSADNYPCYVAFFEERLVFAGSNNDPQKIWASVSGNFEDMTTGAGDDAAFVYVIAADQVNAIQWLSPQNYLLIGTVGGEWRLGSTTAGEPVTATNVTCKRQSTYGSKNIQGLLVNDVVLFVQKAGKKVRELTFSWEKDGYVAPDMTILAEHITGAGIVNTAYQQQPDSILWCVRSDGVLIGMTYERPQEVIGWHRHVTEGEVESVAVIPASDHDQIWVSVKRTIDGTVKRYIEYFKSASIPDEQENCFYVDCGLTYDGGEAKDITGATQANPVVITSTAHGFSNGDKVRIREVQGMVELNWNVYTVANAAANTFELSGIDGTSFGAYTSGGKVEEVAKTVSGLGHLKNKEVSILSDGAVHPDLTVSAGGEVTLDRYANMIHIGLSYSSILETMELNIDLADGTAQGRTKRISSSTIRFYKTIAAKAGYDENSLDSIPFRETDDLMNEPLPFFTGDKEISFPKGYDKSAKVMVVQDQPLPMTVLSIMPRVAVYER